MKPNLCPSCTALGYCRDLKVPMVTDAELSKPEFIRDVRATAYRCGKSADGWLEFANNLYRDFNGRITARQCGRCRSFRDEQHCASCQEVWLDMDALEFPGIRDWFAGWCCSPYPANVTPVVRIEARERVRVLATILKASFPEEARNWGLRAANENRPPCGRGC